MGSTNDNLNLSARVAESGSGKDGPDQEKASTPNQGRAVATGTGVSGSTVITLGVIR